jgi:hypothetical protein
MLTLIRKILGLCNHDWKTTEEFKVYDVEVDYNNWNHEKRRWYNCHKYIQHCNKCQKIRSYEV